MAYKLKKCPFCGSDKETLTGPWFSEHEYTWYLRCWGRNPLEPDKGNHHDLIEFTEHARPLYDKDGKQEALKRLIEKWNYRYNESS